MDAERIKSIILPVIESYGVEITHLSFRYQRSGVALRVDVDRKIEGPVPVPYRGSQIDIKTLENLNREISAAVQAYEPTGARLSVEVSSPGLDRPICRPEEFLFFKGHPLKVQLKLKLGGRRNFRGKLESVEELDGKPVALFIGTPEGPVRIPIADIERVRLDAGCHEMVFDPKERKGRRKNGRRRE